MKNGSARKGRPPPQNPTPPPPAKHQALSQEEDFVDEDVFLDENLLDEDALILRDMEERQALAARLSKWARPPLSQDYVSQSTSIVFQQLEIDYVIGESHRELLSNLSGPAAILRIFGVTREGLHHFTLCKPICFCND